LQRCSISKSQLFDCYVLKNEKYISSEIYADDAKIPFQTIPGLELAVEEIFEK
jgi:Uma2 family endonuclease